MSTTTAQNQHIRFSSETEAEQTADAAFLQIEEPEPEPEHPTPVHVSGDEDEVEDVAEAAEAAEDMDLVSEEEMNDPSNLEGIDKSLYFKELELRAKHATELADMFQSHGAAKAKAPAEGGEAEAEEEAEDAPATAGEKKEGTKKLALALKEQGRHEGRMTDYRRKFARNKVLAKRKRNKRFAGLRAENAEEKALQKAITAAIRKGAKKQQDLAKQAALAAVRDLEAGLSEEVVKELAMKAYTAALVKAAAAEA